VDEALHVCDVAFYSLWDGVSAFGLAMVNVVSWLPKGGPVAQVRGLGPSVGGRLTLFCIHRVNRV